MRAVVVRAFGAADALEPADLPRPALRSNEVLVRVAFAGVNFADVQMRDGSYARPKGRDVPLPMTLGLEGAGRVAAVGTAVADYALGDRVAFCLASGAYAEYTAVAAWKLIRVPDAMPLSIAAALTLQGLTAQYLTRSTFALDRTSTCLVHSAAGGVGQLLVQFAKSAGALVLASVGTQCKAGVAARLGADSVFVLDGADFSQTVRARTGGRGVDVVYDAVGAATLDASIRSLRPLGLYVLYGGSSGAVEAIAPQRLAEAGSLFFTRPHLTHYLAGAAEIEARSADLFGAWRDGKLTVHLGGEFALEDAASAHRLLESRQSRGKLLLNVGGESVAV